MANFIYNGGAIIITQYRYQTGGQGYCALYILLLVLSIIVFTLRANWTEFRSQSF